MLSVHNVVRELRRRLPDAGDVKIHKLAYYCQGWHLAWVGEPIFAESIEAWENGPVIADLWHDEKRDRVRPSGEELDDERLAVLEYVIGRYGRYTGRELVRRTHLEDPWKDVRETADSWAVENPEITHEALRAWFSADDEYLAHRAELARLRQRRDVYGFEGPAMPDELREATLRVVRERA